MAKFEVCCHKFADLSESNYGVSILNDSKYGFATCGHLMRLSLLRAPKAPDGHADMGRHHIRWAIMPHLGPLGADTVRAAHNFNHPMAVYGLTTTGGGSDDAVFSAIRLRGSDSLVLDCVKRGEDDEDVARPGGGGIAHRPGRSVVLRIYEALGGKSRGTIEMSLPVKKVFKCNVLEDDGEVCRLYGGGPLKCDVELRAFEVATFRLQL
jgi:alpha-mannosidase